MKTKLNRREVEKLMIQDPLSRTDGGFQALLVRLQEGVDPSTGEINVTATDLERIARYAFDYGNGGWESRLREIFQRVLGRRLGRK